MQEDYKINQFYFVPLPEKSTHRRTEELFLSVYQTLKTKKQKADLATGVDPLTADHIFIDIIVDAINSFQQDCQLELLSSPFLSSTFTLWRKYGWKKVSKKIKKYAGDERAKLKVLFIDEVDHCLLPCFLKRVKAIYTSKITTSLNEGFGGLSPKLFAILSKRLDAQTIELNRQKFRNNIEELAQILGEWMTQIQFSIDLILSCHLYGLFEDKTTPLSAEDLQKLWEPVHKFELKGVISSLMRDGAIAVGRKFGYSVAKSSRFTIVMKMLTLTEGYSLLMVPFGAAFLPVGSVVLSAGLRYVFTLVLMCQMVGLEVSKEKAGMETLAQEFQQINSALIEVNYKLKGLIREAVLCESKDPPLYEEKKEKIQSLVKYISINNKKLPQFVGAEAKNEMDEVLEELLKDKEMEQEWVRLSWELPDLSSEIDKEYK